MKAAKYIGIICALCLALLLVPCANVAHVRGGGLVGIIVVGLGTSAVVIDLSDKIDEEGYLEEDVILVSSDGMAILEISAGTQALLDGNALWYVAVEPESSPPPPPQANYTASAYNFGPDGATFEPPITLIVSYDPDALPEVIDPEDLVIACYDEGTGEWVVLPTVVNIDDHHVIASLEHFTSFVILAVIAPTPTSMPTGPWPSGGGDGALPSTATPTPMPTPTPTPMPTPTPTVTPTPGLGPGAWAGIGAGIFALIGFPIWLLGRRRFSIYLRTQQFFALLRHNRKDERKIVRRGG